MKQTKESIRLFRSPLLEKFTHVHPITPLVIFIPVLATLFWQSWISDLSFGEISLGAGIGLFFWTFFEYLMHRFVFHFEAKGRIGNRLVFLFHGIHHDQPEDATRLVMPPVVSIVLASSLYFLFRELLGVHWVNPFFFGFLVGYLIYDYTHFAVHHFTPRTPIGRYIKQYHMLHHFVTPEARWGVSSPLWDMILGTSGREQTVKPPQKAV